MSERIKERSEAQEKKQKSLPQEGDVYLRSDDEGVFPISFHQWAADLDGVDLLPNVSVKEAGD